MAQEIEQLCQTAREMEPGKREEYLERACAGDESLRKEVESLLANLTEAEGFMKDPAMDEAARAQAKEQQDALAITVAGIWVFLRFFQRDAALPPPRIVPLTSYAGREIRPSLSADGNWVAFQWKGEKQDNSDIYVKEVDGAGFSRLTTHPAVDCCPSWSPDGRTIAFLRHTGVGDRWILYLVSKIGGSERKLTEVNWIGTPSWSPDGRNIAFRDRTSLEEPGSIWSLSVETLEKTRLTTPPTGSDGDHRPAYSPDGRYLAFIRWYAGGTRFELYVMRLPDGEPRFVTDQNSPVYLCWTEDSREIVFSSSVVTGDPTLWRVPVNGGEPRRVPVRGEAVSMPSIGRNRLAYVSRSDDWAIWRLDLAGKEMKPPSKPLLAWSSWERNPRISPDGSKIAIESDSSGALEIWVCNSDGTGRVKLTDMRAPSTGSPSWSPDGDWLLYCGGFSTSDIMMIDNFR